MFTIKNLYCPAEESEKKYNWEYLTKYTPDPDAQKPQRGLGPLYTDPEQNFTGEEEEGWALDRMLAEEEKSKNTKRNTFRFFGVRDRSLSQTGNNSSDRAHKTSYRGFEPRKSSDNNPHASRFQPDSVQQDRESLKRCDNHAYIFNSWCSTPGTSNNSNQNPQRHQTGTVQVMDSSLVHPQHHPNESSNTPRRQKNK